MSVLRFLESIRGNKPPMTVRFAVDGSPFLSSHEATGLATLLMSFGTPASLRLAAKIDGAVRESTEISLDGEERSALLEAIDEFPSGRVPRVLAQVKASVADAAT